MPVNKAAGMEVQSKGSAFTGLSMGLRYFYPDCIIL